MVRFIGQGRRPLARLWRLRRRAYMKMRKVFVLPLREVLILRMLSWDPQHIVRLMDVKQGQNKEGKTVLYLIFEDMDTDLKKFIKSFRHMGENISVNTVKCLMYKLCKVLDT